MALNFPDNPANNETYIYQSPNGKRTVTYTYREVNDSWTGRLQTGIRLANPTPAQVAGNPAFSNALDVDAGTIDNPYVVTPGVCATQGFGAQSSQQIIITQQTRGEKVNITPDQPSGTRFRQPLGTVNGFGTWTGNLIYRDEPTSTIDGIQYTALLQVGTTYLTWTVEQQVTDPIAKNTDTTILVIGNVWKVGAVAQMVSGTITGGVVGSGYSYEYYWQQSADGSTWTDVTSPSSSDSAKSYTLQESDVGFFIRGVTKATDSTEPVNQTLIIPSVNSGTKVFGPPELNTVFLRDDEATTKRFTDQSFTTTFTFSTQGTGTKVQKIKGILTTEEGTIYYPVIAANGAITSVVTSDPGFVQTTAQNSITLTFPSTFDDTLIPDDVLPPATTFQTVIQSTNDYGADEKSSNTIIPSIEGTITYSALPSNIKGFAQYDLPFLVSENPFNTAVPLGSNKATYSFQWANTPTTIVFNPPWDTTAKPITQFQGGGNAQGINDFEITFVDASDNSTPITVNTADANWALPVSVSTPATIKSITFNTLNTQSTLNGLVQFYAADDSSVLYEDYVLSSARARKEQLEGRDLVAGWATRSAAGTAGQSTAIAPKVVFDSGKPVFLHTARQSGTIDVSLEVGFVGGTSATISATGLSQSVDYGVFVTNLKAGLTTDTKVTVTAANGVMTLAGVAPYVISTIKATITSGSLSTQTTHTVSN